MENLDPVVSVIVVSFAVFQNDQQLDCALDLMRRLPPQQIEKNLSDLIDLVSLLSNTVPGVACAVFYWMIWGAWREKLVSSSQYLYWV